MWKTLSPLYTLLLGKFITLNFLSRGLHFWGIIWGFLVISHIGITLLFLNRHFSISFSWVLLLRIGVRFLPLLSSSPLSFSHLCFTFTSWETRYQAVTPSCRRKCDTWWWFLADFLKWLYVLQQLKIAIHSDSYSLSQWHVYSIFLSSFPGGWSVLFHINFISSFTVHQLQSLLDPAGCELW